MLNISYHMINIRLFILFFICCSNICGICNRLLVFLCLFRVIGLVFILYGRVEMLFMAILLLLSFFIGFGLGDVRFGFILEISF